MSEVVFSLKRFLFAIKLFGFRSRYDSLQNYCFFDKYVFQILDISNNIDILQKTKIMIHIVKLYVIVINNV